MSDDATTARADEPGAPGPAPAGAAPAGPPSSESPRRSFHLLLGSVLLGCFAVPIVWAFAAFWMRRAADPGSRRWARRILGLAILDTVVAVALGFLLVGSGDVLGDAERRTLGRPVADQDRVMIGVALDDSFAGPGARVLSVAPGGPAATAGLRTGDVIVRLGGEEIDGTDTLRRVVRAQRAGIPVAVEWRRDHQLRRTEVVPDRASRISQLPAGGPEPTGDARACFTHATPGLLLSLAAILVLLGTLAAFVGRGSGAGVWWTALSLIAGLGGAYLVAGGTCAIGGWSGPAQGVLPLWGSSLAIAAMALIGLKRIRSSDPASAPRMRWTSALALACWYTLTGGLRLGILLAVVIRLASPGGAAADSLAPVVQAAAEAHGPALVLLALPIVVFGPVGEELAFRGLLQPALARRWGAVAAIAVTSVLFAALHWQYGLKLPVVAFFSVVLGWARVASGGLRAPILLHMLVNAVAFASMWRGSG